MLRRAKAAARRIIAGQISLLSLPKIQRRASPQICIAITSTFCESILDCEMIASILSLPEDGHFARTSNVIGYPVRQIEKINYSMPYPK
jgi:hypothetical protein